MFLAVQDIAERGELKIGAFEDDEPFAGHVRLEVVYILKSCVNVWLSIPFKSAILL